jgi:2,3,4,5-tetrahydropyridine-2-carboxylate N-succinyltransferase
MTDHLQAIIDSAWDDRDSIGASTRGDVRQAVDAAIALLDTGDARIAEKSGGDWIVHQWLKKAVLLSFRLNPMEAISGAPGGAHWWDKVPSKFAGWGETQFSAAAFRAVPGAIVRRGAYVAPGAPEIASIGFSRNDNSTAFFSHWLTTHWPSSCSAIRASPRSSAAMAASTAWRTSPRVAGPIVSRSSQARSITGCNASSIVFPQD